MNKQQRTVKLDRLIKQEAPDWLTDEEYQIYNERRSTLRANFEVEKHIEKIFGVSLNGISAHPTWKSYSFSISPVGLKRNGGIVFFQIPFGCWESQKPS